jgi:hypothetical protein
MTELWFATDFRAAIEAALKIPLGVKDTERGIQVFGPLPGERSHMIVVLFDTPTNVPKDPKGLIAPLPSEFGHGYVCQLEANPLRTQ